MFVRSIVRTTLGAAAMAGVLLVPASGTSATLNLAVADVAESGGSAASPRVTAACKIDGALLEGGGIRFVVSGSAQASGGVAFATHVHCTVRTNFGSYGGPSGDAPGPVAVAAGTSETVPFEKLAGLRVCAYGSAFFQGGITRSTTPSPGC